MFALIAIILFALAAFGVHWSSVNIVDLGLAFLALALLAGNWPIGLIVSRRQ
jgi:Flp pilus assembly protein TadG